MTREALILRGAIVKFLRERGLEDEAKAIENGDYQRHVPLETQRVALQKVIGRNADGLRALAEL